ncbi:MAG: helix-turn-helix transcriptional regulator [Arachnia sp.]
MKSTPILGPAPFEAPETPPIDPARRRVLEALTAMPGGATITELTEALGGHPNTVRHHLQALRADHLVEHLESGLGRTPGRPAARYRATPSGDALLAGGHDILTEYAALAEAFAQRMADSTGTDSDTARGIGRAWGRALATRRLTRTGPGAALTAILSRLGFTPRPAQADPRPDRALVHLTTCPMLASARAHPQVLCQVHTGLIESILEGEEIDGEVHLTPFERPGACLLDVPVAALGTGAQLGRGAPGRA